MPKEYNNLYLSLSLMTFQLFVVLIWVVNDTLRFGLNQDYKVPNSAFLHLHLPAEI